MPPAFLLSFVLWKNFEEKNEREMGLLWLKFLVWCGVGCGDFILASDSSELTN